MKRLQLSSVAPLAILLLATILFWKVWYPRIVDNDVYIAQTAAGSANGANCANALAVTYFNTAANWVTGTPSGTEIGPGTTVHLCGTISTSLSFQGSGSSGLPVTVLFEPGASIQQTGASTAAIINTNGKSYIVLNGGTPCGPNDGASCNGYIEDTENGTGLTYQNSTLGMVASGSTNVTWENLGCYNLYVRTSTSDVAPVNPYPVCFYAQGGSNFTIEHSDFHDANWVIDFSQAVTGMTVADNSIYNANGGAIFGVENSSAMTMSDGSVTGNAIHDFGNWDNPGADQYHHDGVHLYAYIAGGTTPSPSIIITGFTIANNIFYGNWGTNTTSHIYLEGQDENVAIYNNVGLPDTGGSQNLANGSIEVGTRGGSNISVYDNTIVGSGPTTQTTYLLNMGGDAAIAENNVVTGCGECMSTTTPPSGVTYSYTIANNVYATGANNNTFIWCPTSGGACTFTGSFSTWESLSGDTGSQYFAAQSSLGLNGSYQPIAGSPLIGAALNLTSSCSATPPPSLTALCSDYNSSARPATGAWTVGAYNEASASGPSTLAAPWIMADRLNRWLARPLATPDWAWSAPKR